MTAEAPAPAPAPAPAAWELLQARKGRVGMLERCVGCRRPAGIGILAWQDGWYAVPVPTGGYGRVVVFDPWGRAQMTADRVEVPGWRPVTATLNAEGRCARCAHCAKHNLPLGTRPAATTARQGTYRGHR